MRTGSKKSEMKKHFKGGKRKKQIRTGARKRRKTRKINEKVERRLKEAAKRK